MKESFNKITHTNNSDFVTFWILAYFLWNLIRIYLPSIGSLVSSDSS
jgi:hypothetical protein